ncbi:hypothetical protein K2_051 [Salmonella phage Kenya-K2]|uniref:Uncharacterized protein n=1 Tax=Salmonella phage vB_SEnST11_KE04 TaxID=3161162 RepID=A0AAU8GD93_9CAUD|nr:hypothetical protein K2_051 [Salmonella phage Kenya-K2]WCZ56554.1 hypothetical protein K6_052 [Salmonella phage Kenya-K6]WCZ56622.1 hypothetical protein K9_051 [Salmonella phage Kenya-K9]WCZ56751.1 hypothetical protein K22_051 [Salmonella phage Kenya-K22]WCZ56940.1 hypothetical protein K53_050 [Salmonella phage Kenya-K53]WCZ57009.1 hypothetical protein K56_054 [Salmonella phage Kenya-K56]
MKPNDLVTWTGRNGETRYGKVTSLHGIYARVEWWRAHAKKPRYFMMHQDKLIVK